MSEASNPYAIDGSQIGDPPSSFFGKLKYLGPGLILSASIVGSGELIATTALGAKAGFVALWVILASCLVKVMCQIEFGRHAIHSGETTFQAFNQFPGPHFGKGNWSVWVWLTLMLVKPLQVGGIIGGVGIAMNMLVPSVPVMWWVIIVAPIVSLLIFQGWYSLVEKLSIAMIGLFTIFTIACLVAIQTTEFAIVLPEIVSGFRIFDKLPPEVLAVAIAAFGITGVGGDEVMMYNYWLLEKGYAAKTGPRENTEAWLKRAKGWMRVMYLDAFLAMVVYTLMTVAFYLLGAAVLNKQGLQPEGYSMISTLSRMYTDSVGSWAGPVFTIGAVFVLFSTLFSALAGWTRLYSDAFGAIGLIDFSDPKQRKRTIAILSWFFPILWAILFKFFEEPVFMVLAGGTITSVILLLVVMAAIQFRFKRLPDDLKPNRWYDIALIISILAILALAGLAIKGSVEKFQQKRAEKVALVG
ncbi:MAG: Nramp family divalent metal transporter [Verrucomicrobiales bacterium]|nr:Nramp family divalent metal transporter [Verrucomicrobiales bacterium]